MYTLIGTAKLNDIDPQAWLADVLGRIAEIPAARASPLELESPPASRSRRLSRGLHRRLTLKLGAVSD